MNKKLFWQGFGSGMGVAAYIALVATVLSNGQKWFGQINGFWGPVLMLMLLCLSVAVVGLLLFGQPLYLMLTGDKKLAVRQVLSNVGWLFILTVLVLLILTAVK